MRHASVRHGVWRYVKKRTRPRYEGGSRAKPAKPRLKPSACYMAAPRWLLMSEELRELIQAERAELRGWEKLGRAEKSWDELSRAEKRCAELRGAKKTWEDLRAENSWEELIKAEMSWVETSWNKLRQAERSWPEKRWEENLKKKKTKGRYVKRKRQKQNECRSVSATSAEFFNIWLDL